MAIDQQFAWHKQLALNLHQFIAWVMLRDPLSVERIGDVAGQDQPNSYSQRVPFLRQSLLGTEISRLGERRRLEFVDAITEAKRHLRSETLECTARQIGTDGQPHSQRIVINATEWDFLDFNLTTGGAIDFSTGTEWADVRFATARVSELWPEAGIFTPVVADTKRLKKTTAAERLIVELNAMKFDGAVIERMNRGELLKRVTARLEPKVGRGGLSMRSLQRALREMRRE